MRRVHQELFAAYPDFTLHAEELLAREDSNTVALHFTARGEGGAGRRVQAGGPATAGLLPPHSRAPTGLRSATAVLSRRAGYCTSSCCCETV